MHRAKSMMLPKIVEDVEGINAAWPEMKTGAVCEKNLRKIMVAKRQQIAFVTLKI